MKRAGRVPALCANGITVLIVIFEIKKMDLQDLWYMFQFIAEREGYGKEIVLEQFNAILKFADRELRNQLYGNENSENGFETSKKRTSSLRFSKTSSTVALTAGSGNLPADYFQTSSIRYGNVKVWEVTDDGYTERLDNAVLSPTAEYPIAKIGDGIITVYPTSIVSITLDYLKHPTSPQLVLKSENGIYVYDPSNSVQLDWAQEDYIDILRIMLGHLGISIGRNDIVQYVEQKQSKEND